MISQKLLLNLNQYFKTRQKLLKYNLGCIKITKRQTTYRISIFIFNYTNRVLSSINVGMRSWPKVLRLSKGNLNVTYSLIKRTKIWIKSSRKSLRRRCRTSASSNVSSDYRQISQRCRSRSCCENKTFTFIKFGTRHKILWNVTFRTLRYFENKCKVADLSETYT